MFTDYAENAIGLPERLFPDVDFDTNEARYYETQNKIAIAVAEYRYYNKLTQTQLAKKLGVTQAMVSKYESGDYNISLKAAFELFDKIGLRFSCIIEDQNKEPNKEELLSFEATEPSMISDQNTTFPPDLTDDITAA